MHRHPDGPTVGERVTSVPGGVPRGPPVGRARSGAKLFDPEYVGYLLMPFVESPTGDLQDLPLWGHLVMPGRWPG